MLFPASSNPGTAGNRRSRNWLRPPPSQQPVSTPWGIRQAVGFPFAIMLAYLSLVALLVAQLNAMSKTLKESLSIVGATCSVYALISLYVLGEAFQREMGASFREAGSEFSGLAALGQAMAHSFRIEPGSGLYLLVVAMVLLFLVQRLNIIDRLVIRETTPAPMETGQGVEAGTEASHSLLRSEQGGRKLIITGTATVVLAAGLIVSLYLLREPVQGPENARKGLAGTSIQSNEASAVESLRTLNTACITYSTTYGTGYPAALSNLGPCTGANCATSATADLIDGVLSGGTKSGYKFTYTAGAAVDGMIPTYMIVADPVNRGTTGQRGFFTDQSGVIRANRTGTADRSSTPVAYGSPPGRLLAKVWVNKQSGFYHCPGTTFYGKVQPGAYMSQGEALQGGYRPIGNEPCR